MTIQTLARRHVPQCEIARLLGVSEGAVRYQVKRMAAGAVDGRSRQEMCAAKVAAAIERSRIDTLATCAWVRGAETVLIQGPPGVGKTHLAVGLGIKAVEQGFSAQYFRFDELLTELRGDALLPPAQLRRRKYLSTALLLIDELGFEPMNRQDASLFFRLVTYR